MSKASRVLATSLAKLVAAGGELPVSSFSPPQRSELQSYEVRTNAIARIVKSAGSAYQITRREIVDLTLTQLRPMLPDEVPEGMPLRTRNIATRRDSKARRQRMPIYHLLMRPAPAGGAFWTNAEGATLDLVAHCNLTGTAALAVEPGDGWRTSGRLWLVENQTNFDDLSWMPTDAQGSVAYYGGILDGRLLSWLSASRRHDGLVLFSDYDGVGLHQFSRLSRTGVNKDVEFWLMPEWEAMLARFGSAEVWSKTLTHFEIAAKGLKGTAARYRVHALMDSMQRQGLALEQEAVWLGDLAVETCYAHGRARTG
ncbi:hypothetical protein [Luteimonas sp. MHLX1A]|uniref:hypothetical protein n=1 Tax=Alterluteimonas muca TaxID=2878684 RepID=UPI001E5A6A54|nr:hypothetical protein [Luteimonas sp. MHLX1A]MCD9046855.1 hypothetical protein [Luteimonas sp. MHLX1A]